MISVIVAADSCRSEGVHGERPLPGNRSGNSGLRPLQLQLCDNVHCGGEI